MKINQRIFIISLMLFSYVTVTCAQEGANAGKDGGKDGSKDGKGATGPVGDDNPNPASQTGPPERNPRDPRYGNPNFIKDRKKELKNKPAILPNSWFTQFKKPFHPAYMDYCDPYHCNDYHKPACGLNRKTMKFKWFQSGCHIMLHNKCATFRGVIKYDTIAAKWCTIYVMHLRNGGCKTDCDIEAENEIDPVCAYSTVDNHAVLFKNRCAFDAANCRPESFNEYEEMNVKLCYSLI